MNPEFLSEGEAVHDFLFPDRIVLGGIDERSIARRWPSSMQPYGAEVPRLRTNTRTAEMIKYASQRAAGDADLVLERAREPRRGARRHRHRRGHARRAPVSQYFRGRNAEGLPPITGFLQAGCGFGGSCLPKDVSALDGPRPPDRRSTCRCSAPVLEINKAQPRDTVDLLKKHWQNLRGVRVAVLGLAFKPETSDVRESPAFPDHAQLLDEGAVVTAYDPVAVHEAQKAFPDPRVTYTDARSRHGRRCRCGDRGDAVEGIRGRAQHDHETCEAAVCSSTAGAPSTRPAWPLRRHRAVSDGVHRHTSSRALFVIDLKQIEDHRGFFARAWCRDELAAHGLNPQHDAAQRGTSAIARARCAACTIRRRRTRKAKFVRCTRGAVFDVIVDLRAGSPTRGQWFGVELTADNAPACSTCRRASRTATRRWPTTPRSYYIDIGMCTRPPAAGGVRYRRPGVRHPLAAAGDGDLRCRPQLAGLQMNEPPTSAPDKGVLLTGASGFIGRHCLEPLRARGYEVHAVSTRGAVDGHSPASHGTGRPAGPERLGRACARRSQAHASAAPGLVSWCQGSSSPPPRTSRGCAPASSWCRQFAAARRQARRRLRVRLRIRLELRLSARSS